MTAMVVRRQFLGGIAPLDGSRRSVALCEKRQRPIFYQGQAGEVIRCQDLLLEQAKDDLNLIEPGRVHGQPMDADVEAEPQGANPGSQLLGRMGGPIIENEMQHANSLAPEAGEEHPQEDLKFAEALALKTPREGFPAMHQEAREELHSALTLIAVPDMKGMAGACGVVPPVAFRAWIDVFSSAQTMMCPCRRNPCARS